MAASRLNEMNYSYTVFHPASKRSTTIYTNKDLISSASCRALMKEIENNQHAVEGETYRCDRPREMVVYLLSHATKLEKAKRFFRRTRQFRLWLKN